MKYNFHMPLHPDSAQSPHAQAPALTLTPAQPVDLVGKPEREIVNLRRQLAWFQRQIFGRKPDAVQGVPGARQAGGGPFLQVGRKYFEAQGFLSGSPFMKMLNDIRERRAGLEGYLSDPDVPIDTNHLERALRVIPMGRKNWMFSWTELGAKHVGIIQSLLVTCRLHGIDPYDYLVDVLQRVGRGHPAHWSSNSRRACGRRCSPPPAAL